MLLQRVHRVNERDVIGVVHALQQAGAAIVITLPGAYGSGSTVQITPADAAALIKNPATFIAAQCGVTAEQMDQWLEYERSPRCAGWTKQGRRCLKAVSPNAYSEPSEFVARHRVEFCYVHG